jgi:phosphatidylethanolamine-binding protein (PEBP) family uncharacterized protein
VATERGRGDSIILSSVADFALQSSAFDHGGPIPRRHSCEGEDLSPPLSWSGVPEDTRSLALVVDDPDAPAGTFTHWLGWALDPDADGLDEGEAAPVEGRNDFGTNRCPSRRARTWRRRGRRGSFLLASTAFTRGIVVHIQIGLAVEPVDQLDRPLRTMLRIA